MKTEIKRLFTNVKKITLSQQNESLHIQTATQQTAKLRHKNDNKIVNTIVHHTF